MFRRFLAVLILALLLAGCGGKDSGSATAPPAEAAADYTIKVTDQKGDPIAGAVVNICTDTTCQPQTTDENGCIFYSGEMTDYHLEVIKVPEGYEAGENSDLYTGEETELILQVVRK